MKIGMMAAWNQNAGPSICAELIGREWVEMGHDLRIFSFVKEDFHGTAIVGKDEHYVIRCFSTRKQGYLDPRPILEFRPEIFIVQDLGMLPMNELSKIFGRIRRSAVTAHVVHDAGLSSYPPFYQFDWDFLVCFDERYRQFLKKVFDDEDIRIIPHPLFPWQPGNRKTARKKLSLPPDSRIVLVFGHNLQQKLRIVGDLREMSKSYKMFLLIVSENDPGPIKGNGLEIQIRKESPSLSRLYDYLHAADSLVINTGLDEDKVVVPTTIYQCLGSGCPILSYDSSLVKTVPDDVIIKYKSYEELKSKLGELFESSQKALQLNESQKRYINSNSPRRIAEAYLETFRRRSSR